MLRVSVALAALAALGPNLRAQSAPAAAPVMVVVVRHAEKGPDGQDPSLTEAGRRRAAELVRVLRDFAPTALFVTEFKRTQETLAPLAAAAGVAAVTLPARDLDALVRALQTLPPGGRAVVASHSNLVHLIVARISGAQVSELTDADYDRIAVVTLSGPGKGSAVVLRYGEAAAAP